MIGYRLYAELAAVLILIAAFAWWSSHERSIGEQKQIQRDQLAAQQQAAAVAAQELSDRRTIQARSESYEAQLQALQRELDSRPASVVRVCHAANPSPMREATAIASGPGSPSATGLDRTDGQNHSESQPIDIGPDLDAYKRDAQALALRCKAVIDLAPRF